jgi:hypothetical protein
MFEHAPPWRESRTRAEWLLAASGLLAVTIALWISAGIFGLGVALGVLALWIVAGPLVAVLLAQAGLLPLFPEPALHTILLVEGSLAWLLVAESARPDDEWGGGVILQFLVAGIVLAAIAATSWRLAGEYWVVGAAVLGAALLTSYGVHRATLVTAGLVE